MFARVALTYRVRTNLLGKWCFYGVCECVCVLAATAIGARIFRFERPMKKELKDLAQPISRASASIQFAN